MKKKDHHKILIILLLLTGTAVGKLYAQDSVATSPTVIALRYFLPENKIPYLSINTKKKKGRKFEPVANIAVNVFFTEGETKTLLGKTITGTTGEGRVAFPASFRNTWDSVNEFKFVAESIPAKGEELLTADITIKKAILVIDTLTADGVRTVTAQLKEKKGDEWVAVKDIEMKLGIKRMLANLSVGDAETYTSDSTGVASAEFKKDSMPGDDKGNIVLVARVEDNDSYGNLLVERSEPWGRAPIAESNFWHRTLWSTGDRAPLWLLAVALSIIIGVWGTIFYLITQVIRIRKMGRKHEMDAVVW